MNNINEDKTVISTVELDEETQLIQNALEYTKTDISKFDIHIDKTNRNDHLLITNPLENIVMKYNLLTQDELDDLKQNKKFTLNYLIDSYSVNIDKLYKFISTDFNLRLYTSIDKITLDINEDLIDIMIQKQLSILVLLTTTIKGSDEYFILISNPFDYELKDYILSLIEKDIKINFALAKKDIIKKSTIKYIKDDDVKLQFSIESNDNLQILNQNEIEDIEYLDNANVPIIPLVNYIILNAHENSASDIHIEPTEENMIVRYRIDGVLHTDINLPINIHREVVSRIKIISDMNVAEKRLPQDGRVSIKDKDGTSLDLRISTFPTVYGEKVVLRLLEQEALKPSLKDLNLTSAQLDLLETKIHSSYGLVLLTGPTGSGKTTTLYSALSSVDKDRLNIVTLENPVEYRLNGINQMQINETIGLTFESGLRTILRQDPDVIMIGEIRDLTTAGMAIHASLTGHMVFSTLHTNDAVGVIIRLITMGIDPFLVASSVSLVVAQRLIRKICPHCIATYDLEDLKKDLTNKGITKSRIESLNFDLEIMPDFAYGKGCKYCRGSGYLGRQGIFEFFEFNNDIVVEILKPNIDEARIRQLANESNMKTLNENAWNLIVEGVTTIEEVIRVIGE